MKKKFTNILLFALFLSSCDGLYTGDYRSFESKLRGTWVSNETGLYSGSLIINYDTITIEGYPEDWTALMVDDSKRPLRDYPKHVPLTGYSEEGKIFIEYPGSIFNDISYVYTEVGSYPHKVQIAGIYLWRQERNIAICPLDNTV
jgi:hypothetical protein